MKTKGLRASMTPEGLNTEEQIKEVVDRRHLKVVEAGCAVKDV
jgi:hypothetical protein